MDSRPIDSGGRLFRIYVALRPVMEDPVSPRLAHGRQATRGLHGERLASNLNLPLLSLAAFMSTNVDSLFVLLALVGSATHQRMIVLTGYVLGSLGLVAAAIALAELVAGIPLRFTCLLGVLPLLLGVVSLFDRTQTNDDRSFIANGAPPNPSISVGYVVALTLASGADNLAVYVPLYATHLAAEWYLITLILVATTVPWFVGATYLASHRLVGPHLERHGRALLPWLLIAIGVAVLNESSSLHWAWP